MSDSSSSSTDHTKVLSTPRRIGQISLGALVVVLHNRDTRLCGPLAAREDSCAGTVPIRTEVASCEFARIPCPVAFRPQKPRFARFSDGFGQKRSSPLVCLCYALTCSPFSLTPCGQACAPSWRARTASGRRRSGTGVSGVRGREIRWPPAMAARSFHCSDYRTIHCSPTQCTGRISEDRRGAAGRQLERHGKQMDSAARAPCTRPWP